MKSNNQNNFQECLKKEALQGKRLLDKCHKENFPDIVSDFKSWLAETEIQVEKYSKTTKIEFSRIRGNYLAALEAFDRKIPRSQRQLRATKEHILASIRLLNTKLGNG